MFRFLGRTFRLGAKFSVLTARADEFASIVNAGNVRKRLAVRGKSPRRQLRPSAKEFGGLYTTSFPRGKCLDGDGSEDVFEQPDVTDGFGQLENNLLASR